MGSVVQTYCDGCGKDVGEARIGIEALQITTIGTNGSHAVILLCLDLKTPEDYDPVNPPPNVFHSKIQGCGKKVLSKAILGKLYEEVAEYTGDETIQPFPL